MKYIGYIILSYTSITFGEIKNILKNSAGLPGNSFKSGGGDESLKKFFSSLVSMLQDITAIAAVLGICIVGIMYIMSAGEEEKTETAKKYIVAIIIGVFLAFTAWAIISLVDLIPASIKF
jgi:type IV secretory pathway VirB2 component (pilin)